jgi:hypothetical protein
MRKQYQIEITNRFAALENLSDDEDINRAWENIKENRKTSATESLGLHKLKQHKPWFDEECLGFLDQRKKAICLVKTAELKYTHHCRSAVPSLGHILTFYCYIWLIKCCHFFKFRK